MKLELTEAVLRKAGWTDVPFLYELMLDGSLQGSFADRFLTARSHVALLRYLLRGVKSSRPLNGLDGLVEHARVTTLIFDTADRPLGFVRCGTWRSADGCFHAEILNCAVAASCRGAGIGGQMIRRYLERLPDDTEVTAHCTKYARAMQATLKRLHFKRQRAAGRLECYRMTAGASEPAERPPPRRADARRPSHFSS